MHAHAPRHTYAYHAHTHTPIGILECTDVHCGRKGHLAKFCFDTIDHLNLTNKSVWVPYNANPHGPKRYGYQNSHLSCLM